MKNPFTQDLWLKLLAIVLAVSLYYALKTSSTSRIVPRYEGQIQQQ